MDRAGVADSLVSRVRSGDLSATTPQRCRQVFDALVGRRSGIVREVGLVETIDGDADLFHAGASIANTRPGWDVDVRLACGGSGLTREDALLAALGEGLERYVASAHSRGRARLRAQAELPGEALPAAALAQFSREQRSEEGFPFPPVGPETPLRWLGGRRLSDDAPCGVPAFAVYLPYQPEPGEPLAAPGISTGLSCAGSRDAAVSAGLCEVVERDALALTWLLGLSPPRIARDWLWEQAGDLLPPRDETAAYDLTSDVGVPVVWVVCRGRGPRGPLLSVGSACHLDPRRAVRKAALEASQDRVFVRQLVELDPEWQPAEGFSNLADFSRHARLYSVRPDLADEALSFLAGDAGPSDLPSLVRREVAGDGAAREAIVDRLVEAGHDGAWIELTPDWAADLGLHVVKVVVPSLLPLHGHHRLAYLGHARLAERRSAMPRSAVGHRHPIWPYPHPFP